METSSNEDEEPKICTVFSSSTPSGSKNVFDTIAFSIPIPKKDSSAPLSSPPSSTNIFGDVESTTRTFTASRDLFPSSNEIVTHSVQDDEILQEAVNSAANIDLMQSIHLPPPEGNLEQILAVTPELQEMKAEADQEPVDIFTEAASEENRPLTLENLVIQEDLQTVQQIQGEFGQGDEATGTSHSLFQTQQEITSPEEVEQVESPILTANRLFADAPEVPFPVGHFAQPESSEPSTFFNQLSTSASIPDTHQPEIRPSDELSNKVIGPAQTGSPKAPRQPHNTETGTVTASTFNNATYSTLDAIYDAWIPTEETRKILTTVATAVHSGTYFPDKSHMTTPGIIYEDDLIDKVGVNMARIFGEAEASKRRILTADSVTQDDNGLRELIKLGCYRSAINLTKRLLTLYGQGPGKVGHFSKHNPHTLQLWFTRISLVIRIREFTIAESEIDAFKEFCNPDLYYEYYPDAYGKGRKGSMVPFNFRLLAAEILQYSKKSNETIDRLNRILSTVQKIISNVENGWIEDGTCPCTDDERKTQSLDIWRNREIRVFYSLANASLFSKDYHNTFKYLLTLCDKDKEKEPQIRSAIGRFFLQLGDLNTANVYFQSAAEQRLGESDMEQVENLVDSALITIAHGSYPEAFALLQQALLIQPDNFMITNNMAVCLLYMGKVKESLSLMETTVKNNTPELLQENVLLNLSTIYELENSDGHKKNYLLKLISEYKGDGINLASLKMPNLI